MENNKKIIKKAQEILKEYGHDVKTGNLYELFSKLSNENSWNVASSKNVDFNETVLSKFKEEKEEIQEFFYYFKPNRDRVSFEFNREKNKNMYYLGFNYNETMPNESVNFTLRSDVYSNILFHGNMGSGKTVAAVSTALSFLNNNKKDTKLILIDIFKHGADLKSKISETDFKNQIEECYDLNKAILIIDNIYAELVARNEYLRSKKQDTIYNEKKQLSKILFFIEDFNWFLDKMKIDINAYKSRDLRKPLTTPDKFLHILRIGRSFGINIIACSQRCIDIPSMILANFMSKIVFRCSELESQKLLGNKNASLIKEPGIAFDDMKQKHLYFPLGYLSSISEDKFENRFLTNPFQDSRKKILGIF